MKNLVRLEDVMDILIEEGSLLGKEEIPINFSIEVPIFCYRQGISQYLLPTINLIKESFFPINELNLEIEKDPETRDEWLIYDITIKEEIDKALIKYDNYSRQLISIVPWPARNNFRLSYNII